MTKEDILDYVINTPNNTNRMVLSDMLDEFNSNSGGGGADILVVHLNEDEETGNLSIDKTHAELYAAQMAGKPILATSNNYGTLAVRCTSENAFFWTMTSVREYSGSYSGNVLTFTLTSADELSDTAYGVTLV